MKGSKELPHWTGALIGVAAAVVLTWLLRQGSQLIRTASGMGESGGIVAASWILLSGGLVLAVVVWAARFSPLIAGIPAGWFLLRFLPTLVGVLGSPDWYPAWLRSSILQDLNEAGFIVTGLLVAATIGEFLRRRSSETEGAQTERASK